jgi:hypothetical protein
VVRELPARHHPAADTPLPDLLHQQLDRTVVQEKGIPRRHVIGEIRIRSADPGLATIVEGAAAIEEKLIPGAELDGATRKTADADLGSLEVGQDRNLSPGSVCTLSDPLGTFPMTVMGV